MKDLEGFSASHSQIYLYQGILYLFTVSLLVKMTAFSVLELVALFPETAHNQQGARPRPGPPVTEACPTRPCSLLIQSCGHVCAKDMAEHWAEDPVWCQGLA